MVRMACLSTLRTFPSTEVATSVKLHGWSLALIEPDCFPSQCSGHASSGLSAVEAVDEYNLEVSSGKLPLIDLGVQIEKFDEGSGDDLKNTNPRTATWNFSDQRKEQGRMICESADRIVLTLVQQDDAFGRSVVLIFDHSDLGTMGVIINQDLDSLNLGEMYPQNSTDFLRQRGVSWRATACW
eukprot:748632-Hanusia_phi.AAC.3